MSLTKKQKSELGIFLKCVLFIFTIINVLLGFVLLILGGLTVVKSIAQLEGQFLYLGGTIIGMGVMIIGLIVITFAFLNIQDRGK